MGAVSFLGRLAGESERLVDDHYCLILKAHFDLEFWGCCGGRLQANDSPRWDGLAGESHPLAINVDASTLYELACTLSAELCVVGDDLVESARFGGGELFSHGVRLA